MRLTRKTAIAIAVVCGVGAAILVAIYLLSIQKPPIVEAPKVLVPMVVAKIDIPRNTLITADMLDVVEVEQGERPPTAVRSMGEVVNHLATADIAANQPILSNQFEKRTGASLSYQVPPGMRAVTVAIDPVAGVAGFLVPGDYVDVVGTFRVGDETLATTVLQNVQLLALDHRTAVEGVGTDGNKVEKPKAQATTTATLAVTPTEAQKLVLAATEGKIRLVLRSPDDRTFKPLPHTDIVSLTGVSPKKAAEEAAVEEEAPPQAPQPAVAAVAPQKPELTREQKVVVIRGTESSVVIP